MIYLIDLFCGAGGVSTGAALANDVKVIACVNHDKNAIKSHQENHPECLHYTEDIKTLDLTEISQIVNLIRTNDENAIIGLWASLECTNFSKAKGGLPRDADSRTLAEHLFRYIDILSPEIIYIENVEEFMAWGPLDENGKPISKDKGCDYVKWTKNVKKYGYNFEHRILNAANYGAYTSRKRYFAQFAMPHLEIIWPEPTHTKNPQSNGLFNSNLKKWKACKEVLKLDVHGNSIFGRKKNLSDKTYERIYQGLIKFVAGGKEAFLLKYNSINGKTGKYVPPDMDQPSPTVSTQGRLGIVTTQFVSKYFSGRPYDKNISVDNPMGTIKVKDSHSFITTYHGNGSNVHSVENPAPTIPTKDSQAVISSQFLQRDFSSGSNVSSIENPAGAILSSPKLNMVSSQFLMDSQYNNTARSIENPAPTQTANRKHFYLMNPQYMNSGSSIENPSFTLIARMDKMPPYLIEAQNGQLAIEIYDTDSKHMVLIKQFMAMYTIVDIKMRMLDIDELLRIQGFPSDYKLIGTQAEKKKYIGNAVEVNQAKVILESSATNILKLKKAV